MPDQPKDLSAIARVIIRSMRAVLWSFFGVRKGTEHERDLASLHPLHVIIAGFVCAAVFIGILLVVVHFVTQPSVESRQPVSVVDDCGQDRTCIKKELD